MFASQYSLQSQTHSGIHNNLADALSRLQVQTFRHLAPAHMDPLPTDIPQHLQPQNWVQ